VSSLDIDSPARRDKQSLVCENIPMWKHLANSLVSAPLTPAAPVSSPWGPSYLWLVGMCLQVEMCLQVGMWLQKKGARETGTNL